MKIVLVTVSVYRWRKQITDSRLWANLGFFKLKGGAVEPVAEQEKVRWILGLLTSDWAKATASVLVGVFAAGYLEAWRENRKNKKIKKVVKNEIELNINEIKVFNEKLLHHDSVFKDVPELSIRFEIWNNQFSTLNIILPIKQFYIYNDIYINLNKIENNHRKYERMMKNQSQTGVNVNSSEYDKCRDEIFDLVEKTENLYKIII